MPAYWMARSRIIERVPAIIAKFGGKVLARGGKYRVMEGPPTFQRFVVIEFRTLEQAVASRT